MFLAHDVRPSRCEVPCRRRRHRRRSPTFCSLKVWREGWAFWGPLENNHRRVAFFNCIYPVRGVVTARHRLLCGVESILSARPVATALWGIDLATWDTRGITCNWQAPLEDRRSCPTQGPCPPCYRNDLLVVFYRNVLSLSVFS